ncbi:Hypothetical protein C900_05049 [Fulvivirga imtechensis AK7]|uniref:Uncharacterized protein n=1 Tax=Fulvivirga imtechensis AK7 TaxID=1237149 RepID=L8JQ58_9BACT|nr:DUF892 family protein [Fulvivirga imtechensis]ELR69517.1 Hypothetical protein C900_05049 [Fulvivirga imtechensis AK7]
MTTKLENLKDLFLEQGRELYDAAKQEQKELPGIQKQVTNQQLRKIIDRQLDVANTEIRYLDEAFKKLNASAQGEKNHCCESIIKQTKSLIDRSKDAEVRDAVIVNSIQRLNHNKITGFGSLTSYAKEIGHKEIADSLHKALEQEKGIDQDLSNLAEKEINRKAVSMAL